MAIIKVDSIEDIKFLENPVYKGSFGKVYPFDNDTYFKKISPFQGNLSFLDNRIRLEILTSLMDLRGTKYLVLPKDIYVTINSLVGYTTPIKRAKTIRDISLDTKYGDVIKAFDLIKDDIKALASLGIFDVDIHQDNILFDEKMYLLDFDQSIYVEDDELAYQRMLYEIFQTIYLAVIKDGFGSPLLMEKDLEGLISDYKKYRSTNYTLFFELLRWKLEFYTRERIKTVGDLRRSLSLTKKG